MIFQKCALHTKLDINVLLQSLDLYVYVIWMWIDWYWKYQPAEPEYEVGDEQADIFQYQSSIILKWNTSIFVFSQEKNHMIQNIQNTLPQNIVHK